MNQRNLDEKTLKIIRHEINNSLANLALLVESINDLHIKNLIIKEIYDINNFLLYIYATNTENQINQFDIVEMVRNLTLSDENVKIITDLSNFKVNANTIAVSHMIENLVSNAKKYGDGKVEISIALRDDGLKLSVYNNGSPLSKQEERSIFDYGFRANNSKNIKGEGIGLFFVKNLAEYENIKISYEYTKGHVFSLNFLTI